ncbi:glucan endo-1,3-beta-glucosidase 3 isoform X1 [Cryptomeria japonica]|uniref:glucan endo-1,3-beta-glucosidase 3 isoform X1 n=1 Tax=Cryptomeria japonica TaxID=3369 RepID=UPI0025AB8520|nr:glucan endo-1,3-beta-glucosidase 3 isoform X1 [Cryptomeria japonica]
MQGERLVFAERMLDCIRVLLLLLSSFGFSIHGGAGAGAFVGLNVGTSLSNMPSPDQVVSLLKIKKIRHVRLYDSDRGMLLALANTSIEVIISIPNNQVLALGESNSSAANWVNKNVAGYLPDTKITGIVVGNEILTSLPNAAIVLVSAMKFLHSALVAANLDGQVKVSSSHSFDIIREAFPPSQAYFNQSFNNVIESMLEFLQETDSYLMMNLYPYYTYMQGNGKVPLDYALFQPLTPEKEAVDPNTLLHYTNVFDAMVDAVYYSMSNLNYTNISVVVAETGWPSKGDASEPRATTDNAATYNSNLVKHIFNITGTPKRPGVPVNTYIYELYNEDLKPGPLSEQNWGLFNANGTPVYALHVSGAGEFLANNITNQSYCVAKPGADTKLLQAALDWACGPGQANCTAIQGGEDCFNPDTVGAHASYAFNSYYHKTGMAMGSCDFKGVATITTTNPSHDSCFYSGSGRGNDSTGNGTTFADSRSTYLIANDSMALYILVLFLSLLLIVDRQI